ncbi:hypothetical protein FGO68_gene93 [Halteria grandinella]|uniref:Secreted protein n=1 Tax=Halteria grandinella TaxID=5974 RepID=A0A8J8NNT2_HALGN|nr:hypothetical protein FGO68_gene93 [Halteria grandinella]
MRQSFLFHSLLSMLMRCSTVPLANGIQSQAQGYRNNRDDIEMCNHQCSDKPATVRQRGVSLSDACGTTKV